MESCAAGEMSLEAVLEERFSASALRVLRAEAEGLRERLVSSAVRGRKRLRRRVTVGRTPLGECLRQLEQTRRQWEAKARGEPEGTPLSEEAQVTLLNLLEKGLALMERVEALRERKSRRSPRRRRKEKGGEGQEQDPGGGERSGDSAARDGAGTRHSQGEEGEEDPGEEEGHHGSHTHEGDGDSGGDSEHEPHDGDGDGEEDKGAASEGPGTQHSKGKDWQEGKGSSVGLDALEVEEEEGPYQSPLQENKGKGDLEDNSDGDESDEDSSQETGDDDHHEVDGDGNSDEGKESHARHDAAREKGQHQGKNFAPEEICPKGGEGRALQPQRSQLEMGDPQPGGKGGNMDCGEGGQDHDSCTGSRNTWHREVTPEERSLLVQNFAKTISPDNDSEAAKKILEAYARQIEEEVYSVADSKMEYHHLMAEKLNAMNRKLDDTLRSPSSNHGIRRNEQPPLQGPWIQLPGVTSVATTTGRVQPPELPSCVPSAAAQKRPPSELEAADYPSKALQIQEPTSLKRPQRRDPPQPEEVTCVESSGESLAGCESALQGEDSEPPRKKQKVNPASGTQEPSLTWELFAVLQKHVALTINQNMEKVSDVVSRLHGTALKDTEEAKALMAALEKAQALSKSFFEDA